MQLSLKNSFKPVNTQDYYWGAVAPDVRYVVKGMPKRQTHISSEKIMDYIHKYPKLKDFLNGYLVHCLSDELSLHKIVRRQFPFLLIKKKITKKNCPVILEFLNIESGSVPKLFFGENNPVLSELGISDEYVIKFSRDISSYLNSPSYTSSIKLHQNLGLKTSIRIEKYQKAIQLWRRIWFLKRLILVGLQLKKVNRELAKLVRSGISKVLMV